MVVVVVVVLVVGASLVLVSVAAPELESAVPPVAGSVAASVPEVVVVASLPSPQPASERDSAHKQERSPGRRDIGAEDKVSRSQLAVAAFVSLHGG